jgi:hypothetical protein
LRGAVASTVVGPTAAGENILQLRHIFLTLVVVRREN